jgi:D-arabinose 1-dehydrogenase-like Zn-dependent alcohol dehydrogenase
LPDLPRTQHAIQFTGPNEVVHNTAKPVFRPGQYQLVLKVEAVGICFSDTKLLHAFTAHPRTSEVLSGVNRDVLAEIPSYTPGGLPLVPGHECAGRIVAVGSKVHRHRVGERVLVQTDYRHLPTAQANAAFGYNFEGGLQEYVLLDERMIIDPDTGERFLIPVGDDPSGSAVGLLEPWACVERSYASEERNGLAPGGRLLVVAEPGHTLNGLDELVAATPPGHVTGSMADEAQTAALAATVARAVVEVRLLESLDETNGQRFDDIVYFGADAARIEALQDLLGPRGTIDVVLNGATVDRPVAIDVGRIHYDLLRWVGTSGDSAATGYASVPATGELRAGDRMAVVGAAGPMGFMHVIRALSMGIPGIAVDAIDIDDARLAHLAEIAGPLAEQAGLTARFVNSRTEPVTEGAYDYVAVMVPAPPLVLQAIAMAAPAARVNLFAGFPVGTRAAIDLTDILARGLYLFGTSGSEIRDMQAVLARLEAGHLDTNLSLDAVCGMEGVADALAAVEARSSGGKIVVYPQLHDLGMVRLGELATRFPGVAAKLHDGRWTREAEEELLAEAGDGGASQDPSGRHPSGPSGAGG